MEFENMFTHYESEYFDKILDFIGEDGEFIQITPSYKADNSKKTLGNGRV